MEIGSAYRRSIRRGAILASASGLLLAAANAHAATFCVSDPTCAFTGTPKATIQAAFDDAALPANPGKDNVLIGFGTFAGGTAAAGNPVDVSGASTNLTKISQSGTQTTQLSLADPGSTLTRVGIELDASDVYGLHLTGGSASNIEVGGTSASFAIPSGVLLEGGALRDSQILMGAIAGSEGVTGFSTTSTVVERSHIEAGDAGVSGVQTLRRVSIEASTTGIVLRDQAVIDHATIRPLTVGIDAAISFASSAPSSTAVAKHVTAVGGGVGSTGIRVSAECDPIFNPQQVTLTLRNSILRGMATDRNVTGTACPGGTSLATLDTTHSIFDPAKTTTNAQGVFKEAGTTIASSSLGSTSLNVDPLFANQATGDFHLASGSPAIDAGDPAAIGAEELTVDFDGNERVLDGNGDGTARRDIGAFESPAVAPPPSPDPTPESDTTAPNLVLGGKSRQKADGTIEVEVSCDEACTATGGGVLTVKPAKKGRRNSARAGKKNFDLGTDSASLTAGGDATFELTFTRKAARAVSRALKHNGRSSAAISVDATDAAGNAAQAASSVKLKPKRR
jgi:hypothetical protein